MPLPISRSALQSLGRRLAKSTATEADWEKLYEVLEHYRLASVEAQELLRQVGFELTARVKSRDTLIDKIRTGSSLASIQDVAGIRLDPCADLDEQDDIVLQVGRLFEEGSVVKDRRPEPNHGYRAVHVVVTCQALPVEIQVRTILQNGWAQIIERMGDRWGRGLRYGQVDTTLDHELRPGLTRRDLYQLAMRAGEHIAEVEVRRQVLRRMRRALDDLDRVMLSNTDTREDRYGQPIPGSSPAWNSISRRGSGGASWQCRSKWRGTSWTPCARCLL
ncbi:MAG: RelA/SpoT domain-containing protein [Dermatophilaceae bacterium]